MKLYGQMVYLGQEKRISNKTGKEYTMAAFLQGLDSMKLFLPDEIRLEKEGVTCDCEFGYDERRGLRLINAVPVK